MTETSNYSSFKAWYMQVYLNIDDLFIISAKALGITYHEFVLISLCVVWPLYTIISTVYCFYLLGKLRASNKIFKEYYQKLSHYRLPRQFGAQGTAAKGRSSLGDGTASEGEILAAPERISRNSLCPCGSGRKYKHCHGATDGAG
jgi:hypothetical protein